MIFRRNLPRKNKVHVRPVRLRRYAVEALEDRMMLSTVSWTGGGGDNLWTDAKNWNTGAVPAAGDDVAIIISGTTPSIHISSGSQSVNSLTSNASISIDGGSLTDATAAQISGSVTLGNAAIFGGTWIIAGGLQVSGAATLNGVTLDGALGIQNGQSLTLTGATSLNGAVTFGTNVSLTDATGEATTIPGMTGLSNVNLTAQNGTVLTFPAVTTLSSVNMSASTGGQIAFPAATKYTGSNGGDTTIQAAGGKIDLSHLQTLAGGGFDSVHNSSYTTHILVSAGGEIDLAGAISSNGGNRNDIEVSGAGSVLGVTGVASLAHSQVTVAAGLAVSFPAATALAALDLAANGGQIAFPAATKYTGSNGGDTTIQAAGGKIDLSHLQTLNGGGFDSVHNSSYTTHILVSAGGEIDLAGAIDSNGGNRNDIEVSGAGSVLGVTGVASLAHSQVTVAAGLAVSFPAATTLAALDLTANGGQIAFPAATKYTGSNGGDTTIQAAGGKIDLSHLQTLNGGGFDSVHNSSYTTHILVSAGGEIDLAGAIDSNGGNRNDIEVSGAGSVLGVTGVASLAHSQVTVAAGLAVSFPAATTLAALDLAANGGQIAFPAATKYTGSNGGDTTIQAAGGKIDLSHLQTLNGGGFDSVHNSSYTTHILVSAGGEIDLAGAIDSNGGNRNDIEVSGAGSVLGVTGVASLAHSQVTVAAGLAVSFPAATTLAALDLAANGGQIAFPAATKYTGSNGGDTTIQAAGGKIDLSHLQTLNGGGFDSVHNSSYTTHILVSAGGEIDLAGAIDSNGGNRNDIEVSGAGSVLGVTGVTSLAHSQVTVAAGLAVSFPAATTLAALDLTANGGQIAFPAATKYTGSNGGDTTIQAAGGKIDLSHLQTLAGGGFDSVHNSSYTTHILVSAGGEIDLAGAIDSNGGNRNDIEVSGAGSVLGVTGVASLAHSQVTVATGLAVSFPAATTLAALDLTANGGQIAFPAATKYTGSNGGDTTIQAAGGKIDLSHLQTLNGGGFDSVHNSSYTTHILVSAGGEIDLAGAIDSNGGNRNDIEVSGAGSVLGVTGVASLAHSQVTVAAGLAVSFPAATTLAALDLTANGGQIAFPAATKYTGSNGGDTTIQAAGGKIDLSHLQTLNGGGFDSVHNSSYTTHILVSAGGEIDLAGAIDSNGGNRNDIEVSGAGSVLGVTGVTSLAHSQVTVAAGLAVSFPAATTLAALDLTANGGQIAFPAATKYTGSNGGDTTIQAAGGKIDLSHLQTLAGGGFDSVHNSSYTTHILVSAGGGIDLAGAISSNGGNRNDIEVSGAGSVLGVTGVTSLAHSQVTVAAGLAVSFPAATAIAALDLTANGGQIAFPAATKYTGSNGGDTTIQAAGGKIDLSHLQTLAGGGFDSVHNSSYTTHILVSAGGEIDLAGAIDSNGGNRNDIEVSGAGSVLGVTGVASLAHSQVTVAAGLAVSFPAATTLAALDLTANGGQIAFPAATKYTGSNGGDTTIQVAGGKIDLSHLQTLNGGGFDSVHNSSYTTHILVSAGGEIDLAGAIDSNGGNRNDIEVSGAGSVLGVTGVASLAHSQVTVAAGLAVSFPAATTLAALDLAANGGQIAFPAATKYTGSNGGDTTIQAAGGKIDLSHLQTLAGGGFDSVHNSSYTTHILVSAGGEIDLAGAISSNGGNRNDIEVSGAGSVLGVTGVTSLAHSQVTVAAGLAVSFPAATAIAALDLTANGGQIAFPAATKYTGSNGGDTTIQAAGGKIDLSHLQTLAGGGFDSVHNSSYTTHILASAGGEIDLAGAIDSNGGNRNDIEVSGAGSVLGVTGVTSIKSSFFTAANGATWTFPAGWNPTWGAGDSLSTTGTGSSFVNQGTITVSGVSLAINTGAFANQGTLNPVFRGTLAFNGNFRVNGSGILAGDSTGQVTVGGDLLGNTNNASQFAPAGDVLFSGSGTATSPQQLEAMSVDDGAVNSGFNHNFAYGTLTLANNTCVQLVNDARNNTASTKPEAVYVNTIAVPAGTTLDLNNLHMYARTLEIGGTVVNGTLQQVNAMPISAVNTIGNASFETNSAWTAGANDPNGDHSAGYTTAWASNGSQSYEFTRSTGATSAGSWVGISQTVNLSGVLGLLFDCQDTGIDEEPLQFLIDGVVVGQWANDGWPIGTLDPTGWGHTATTYNIEIPFAAAFTGSHTLTIREYTPGNYFPADPKIYDIDNLRELGGPTVAVTGISPASGLAAGGTTVTITGTGFTGASAVDFGAVAATSFVVDSDTQITATSPAEPLGTVDVTVTATDGTSASATSSADQFSYALAAPSGLWTTPLINECQVSWNPLPGADSYQVWRNTTNDHATNDNTPASEIAAGIKATTYDDPAATPGVTYYYWIVAADGPLSGMFGAPAMGSAIAGTATSVELGELELLGTFNPGGGSTYTANGTVEIGFTPASGQTFQPLLTVAGPNASVSYNDSSISVNGTVSANIGNLALPLLSGSFEIPLGQAGEANTAPNTLNDSDPSGSEELAGLPIQIMGLALVPAGSGTSSPEIEVQGDVSLPVLNTTLNAAVFITNQGLQPASFTLPEIDFSLAGLNIDATQMSANYLPASNTFLIQGSLALNDLIQGTSITADLNDQDGDGISIQGSRVTLVGALKLTNITLPNGWVVNAQLSFNTSTQDYYGTADVDIAGVCDINGSLTIRNGHLDSMSLSLGNVSAPGIPIAGTGFFLTGGSASIINLAPTASSPITLNIVSLDLSYGPDSTVNLPGWLGGDHVNCSIATLHIDNFSMNRDDLSTTATLTLAGGLVGKTTAHIDLNFATGVFTASAWMEFADNTFSGEAHLTIGKDGAVTLAASGTVTIPVICLSGNADLELSYQPLVPLSQDYVKAWVTIDGFLCSCTAGVRVGFNGNWKLFGGVSFNWFDPPASETFSVPSGTSWALLGASWTNDNTNVPFDLLSPGGTLYTQANLPGNVCIETTGSTGFTVGIHDPGAGSWVLTLPDTDGLGTVSFQSLGGTATPVIGKNLALLQPPASAVSGCAFNSPPMVAVEDQNGNVITTDDSVVTLTVSSGPGNTSTVLTSPAKNGVATFDGIVLRTAGSYTLTATDGADVAASTPSFAVAPAAVSSLTLAQPTSAVAGQDIGPAIVVCAKDQYGNAVPGDTVTLAVKSASGAISCSFQGTTDASGNATFAAISLPTAGTYTLVASDGAVSSGQSKGFTVSPAAASALMFATQPSNAPAGTAIDPSIVVNVEDRFGNLITTANPIVVLSLDGDASLNGTLAVQANDGVATFNNISVNETGVYAISASDESLGPVASAGFTISPAKPTVTLGSPPAQIVYDGTNDVTKWAIAGVSGGSGMAIPTGSPTVEFYNGASAKGAGSGFGPDKRRDLHGRGLLCRGCQLPGGAERAGDVHHPDRRLGRILAELAGNVPGGDDDLDQRDLQRSGRGDGDAAVGTQCGQRRNGRLPGWKRYSDAHLHLHRGRGTGHFRSGLCLDRRADAQRRDDQGRGAERGGEPGGASVARPGRGHGRAGGEGHCRGAAVGRLRERQFQCLALAIVARRRGRGLGRPGALRHTAAVSPRNRGRSARQATVP